VDLGLHGTVIRRYWHVGLAGVLLGLALAVLTYARPSWENGRPSLEPRAAEVWQTSSTLLLTRSGFPEGRVFAPGDPGRFYQLADIYARVATSDGVMAILRKSGPVNGSISAFNPPSSTSGPSPVLALSGSARTAAEAVDLTRRAARAFTQYLEQRQRAARIPQAERVRVQVLSNPSSSALVQPRKKTFAIVVFLAALSATFALVYVLESFRRGREATRLTAVPQAESKLVAEEEMDRRTEPEPVSESVTTSRWA